MGRANNFAHELVKTLQARKSNYSWEIAKPIGDYRESVDAVGKGTKRWILIEVELRRYGPVANIVKIWKWLVKDSKAFEGKKITVIQAFSSFYGREGRPFLRENSEFLGRQLQARFKDRVRYVAVSFDYNPYKKRVTVSAAQGGGAMRNAARRLARDIALRTS
jgi:hypothetical protein